MSKQTEALKLALDMLKQNDEFLYLFHECESEEEIDQYTLIRKRNENAITFAEKALAYAPSEREQPAQQQQNAENLYWRLHSLSKSLEGAGRLDEHDCPDAYATILDAMQAAQAARQEPVGTVKELFTQAAWERLDLRGSTKVYTSPPANANAGPSRGDIKPWVGLTDDETRKINQEVWGYVSADHTRMWDYARAIEAKLREKNHG